MVMVKLARSCKSFCFFMVTKNSRILLGIIAIILIIFYLRQLTAPVHTDFDKPERSFVKGNKYNDFGPKSPEAYRRSRHKQFGAHEQIHYTLMPGIVNEGYVRKKLPRKPDDRSIPARGHLPNLLEGKQPSLQIKPPFKVDIDHGGKDEKKPEWKEVPSLPQKLPRPMKLQPVKQELIDYIADYLVVSAEIITNLKEDFFSMIRYTFNNYGTNPIPPGNWQIYVQSLRKLEPKHAPYDDGYVVPGSGLRLFFVDGYLYRLEPDPATYRTLLPKTSFATTLECYASYVSRSDFLPNWYVVSEGTKPRIIKSTAGDDLKFVEQIDSPAKWKRKRDDAYNPFQPELRFNLNVDAKDQGGAENRFVPTPVKVFPSKGAVTLNPRLWKVVQSVDFDEEAKHLAELFQLQLVQSKPQTNFITFEKVPTTVLGQKHTNNDAYSVLVSPDELNIKITANKNPGAFYAVKTLFKMSNQTENGRRVPAGGIADEPRYSYRGLHLDVSRNFQSKETVMRLLDIMATYKLNKFHMHLSDDEGWRLEIPGLPELTQLSSNRCHNNKDSRCLWPQLGSVPESKAPGSGFYTIGDYKEILMYAKKRHIQVIPEIDLPGHARAAILAMEDRYKKFKSQGNMEEALKYGISDLSDLTGFRSVQGFKNNAFNPCQESSFTFLRHVMKAIKEMHKDIQPLTLFHFGGDEVSKKAWVNSTLCRRSKLVQQNNETESWKEYFFQRIMKMATEEDLSLGAWEDGMMNQKTKMAYDKSKYTDSKRPMYAYPWNNIWESGNGDRAYRLANAGYKVVMSHSTHLYFDLAHEPDPEEKGLYWATRYIDTKRAWGFMPEHLYWNADVSRMGIPITEEDMCGEAKNCTVLRKPENIIGMECHLWGELLRSQDITDHMVFPRIFALAERAWHKAPWEDISDFAKQRNEKTKDWSQFANTIGYRELKYLDSINVKYRIPPPGGEIRDGKLFVNSVFPGLEIQYSRDIGITWSNAQQAPNIKHGETIYLRTMSTDKKRYSRLIKMVHDIHKKDVIPQPVQQPAKRFSDGKDLQQQRLGVNQMSQRSDNHQPNDDDQDIQKQNDPVHANIPFNNAKVAAPVFKGNPFQMNRDKQQFRNEHQGEGQQEKDSISRHQGQVRENVIHQGRKVPGQFSEGQEQRKQGNFPQEQGRVRDNQGQGHINLNQDIHPEHARRKFEGHPFEGHRQQKQGDFLQERGQVRENENIPGKQGNQGQGPINLNQDIHSENIHRKFRGQHLEGLRQQSQGQFSQEKRRVRENDGNSVRQGSEGQGQINPIESVHLKRQELKSPDQVPKEQGRQSQDRFPQEQGQKQQDILHPGVLGKPDNKNQAILPGNDDVSQGLGRVKVDKYQANEAGQNQQSNDIFDPRNRGLGAPFRGHKGKGPLMGQL